MNRNLDFWSGFEKVEWKSTTNVRFTHRSIESCQDEAVLASETRMSAEKVLEYECTGATGAFILKGQHQRSLRAVRATCCDS